LPSFEVNTGGARASYVPPAVFPSSRSPPLSLVRRLLLLGFFSLTWASVKANALYANTPEITPTQLSCALWACAGRSQKKSPGMNWTS